MTAAPDPAVAAPATRRSAVLGSGTPGPVGRQTTSGFLGLSIEFQAVRSYTAPTRRINPVFVQLIRNLTPDQAPVLRIGGDSTDASWVPAPGTRRR